MTSLRQRRLEVLDGCDSTPMDSVRLALAVLLWALAAAGRRDACISAIVVVLSGVDEVSGDAHAAA